MSKHIPEVYRAAERLNDEIAYARKAGYRVNVELENWDIGIGGKGVWVEVLQPIPPGEVPVALSEPA